MEKYGFVTKKGGLTIYEGTMTDSEPIKNITISYDKKVITYEKKGYTVQLDITWGDRAPTGYKRTISRDGNVIFADEEDDAT